MARRGDLIGEVAAVAREVPYPDGRLPVAGSELEDKRRQRDMAKRMEALSLRLAGLSYAQIGEKLGIDPKTVIDLVNRTLTVAENQAVEELREIENARLDRAQASIWTQVLEGNLAAVDSFLRLSQRRAKMNGLDAPTSINLSIGIRQEMETAFATLEQMVLGEVTSSRVLDDDPDRSDPG